MSEDVFLRAILANPAEETAWLVYADWLQEHGNPRATLYRRRRRTNSIGVELVLVPRGTFWMGDRGEQRRVTIPQEFYIGALPVTQGQWQAVVGRNPIQTSFPLWGSGTVEGTSDTDLEQFPVRDVSWCDAQEFLNRLNAREKGNGLLYRLPTEAEWEYACRGAASSQEECAFDFYLAQPTNDLSSEQANFNGNHPAGDAPRGPNLERTTKVGSYPPNRLGLYDMHGNVWEWCEDLVKTEYGTCGVFRGGCYHRPGEFCTASYRGFDPPEDGHWDQGFRLAAVPSGE